jgi:RsiW-degrading membrane proteinase PrsW (M82 family)
MFVRFMCLRCGGKIKADISRVGEDLACPACRYMQQVPPPSQADITAARNEMRNQAAGLASTDPASEPSEMVVATKLKRIRTGRGSCYMILLLASLPLFLAIVFDDHLTFEQKVEKTLSTMQPREKERANKVFQAYKRDEADYEEVLELLPNHRVVGAWRPYYSRWHLYLTLGATLAYVLLLGFLFPEGYSRYHVKLGVMLFTATFGVALLFAVQAIALSGKGAAFGPFGFFFVLIGIAYNISNMPDVSFGTLLLANTVGVGLLEELVKAMPVFMLLMYRTKLRWFECAALGMASGLGFGLAEAYEYGHRYHGVHDQLAYWLRYISCVVSHGVSTAAAALMAHRYQSLLHNQHSDLGEIVMRLLILIGIPMILHGLYNTLSDKNMDGLALAVDLVNFGWLAIMIELARDHEGDKQIEVSS